MTDSSQEAVGFVEEVTWNTTPASALQAAAYVTGVSGGLDRTVSRTNSLRANFVRPTSVLEGDSGSLSLNYELCYDDVVVNLLMEGLLRTDWTAAQTVTATDISFTNADNSINSVAEDLTVFPVGTWVRVAGTTSNDGRHFVVTSTTAKLTIGTQTTIADESAGTSFTLDNDGYLRHGTTPKSYTVERNFTGQSATPFRAQAGNRVSEVSMDIQSGIITGTVGFSGSPPLADAAATAGSGAYTAAVTTPLFSGTNSFGTFLENGATYAGSVSQVQLSLNAGARVQMELGNTTPKGIGSNSFDFSGTITVYKDDNSDSIYSRVRSFTPSFVSFALTDPDGNILQITLPRILYTGGPADNPGNDQDVYQALPFNVDEDPTYGYLMQIDRFAA